MGQSQARESVESGDEDTDVCGPESISYLPKPNALQVQFLEYVANGNVDQLTEFVKKHEVNLFPV
jgi:hypothetical protein